MKLTAKPPMPFDRNPFLSEDESWTVQYGDGIIRNLPKDFAIELCRRWNLQENLK